MGSVTIGKERLDFPADFSARLEFAELGFVGAVFVEYLETFIHLFSQ